MRNREGNKNCRARFPEKPGRPRYFSSGAADDLREMKALKYGRRSDVTRLRRRLRPARFRELLGTAARDLEHGLRLEPAPVAPRSVRRARRRWQDS